MKCQRKLIIINASTCHNSIVRYVMERFTCIQFLPGFEQELKTSGKASAKVHCLEPESVTLVYLKSALHL